MALAKAFMIHGKILSLHITTIDLKFLLQFRMMNFIHLIDHIIFQTFKTILSTLLKNMRL